MAVDIDGRSLLKKLDTVVNFLAGLALVIGSLLLLFSVIYRYIILYLHELSNDSVIIEYMVDIFSSVSVTADEIPGYLLIWISFLGAYLAIRDNKHIRFDMFDGEKMAKYKPIFHLVADMLVLLFFALLFYYSIRMIIVNGNTEIETAEIPEAYFMYIFPLSSCLIIYATLVDIHKRYKKI